MAKIGSIALPVFVRIGAGGEHQVGQVHVDIEAAPAGDHWVVVNPTPKQIGQALSRALIDAFEVVDAEIEEATDEVVGTVCGGQDSIVRFVTEQLGFELTGWQKTYLTKAFQECPDCHHWIHSASWLGVRSTPCPHCDCTG